MAIDWTKIEGYREDMTAEERLALLDDMDVAPKGTTVLKSVFDKTSSDLAAAKKEIKKRMSDDEQREAERTAEDSALREELAELKKKQESISAQLRNNQGLQAKVNSFASAAERLDHHMTEWDEEFIRQMIHTVEVISADRIRVVLTDGTVVMQEVHNQ